MPKNIVSRISLLISWMMIHCSPLVGSSSSYKTQIPDSDFPYTYWKPIITNQNSQLVPYINNDTQHLGTYGHYYGEPISTDDDIEGPTSWNASPIKVPKDVVGEVNEKTTVQPNPYNIVTPYPSSFTPQYGRHPGATEPQPQYFPQNTGNNYHNLERIDHSDSSYSQYNPIQNPVQEEETHENIPKPHIIMKQMRNPLETRAKLEPFTNSEASNYNIGSPIVRPGKLINIINIDRNDDPPPHVFYAIEDPSQVEMKILQKNDTHTKYVTPQEQRRRYFINHPNRVWTPKYPHRHFVRQRPRFRYNWYNKRKKFPQPHYPRKKYNENIIDLMKSKVENKIRKNFDVNHQITYSSGQKLYRKENEFITNPLKNNRNKYLDDYNYINKPEKNVVSIVRATNLSDYLTPDTVFIPKPVPLNTNYIEPYPQPSIPTRQQSQISHDLDNYGRYSVPSADRVPKPAPNAYPNHYGYSDHYRPNDYTHLYSKNNHIRYEEDEEDYDAFAQRIIERMAGLQSIPASVVIPGGLAALGLGLAYYYFNYVWYPTPVVTARLSEFLRSLDDGKNYRTTDESASTIGKIIEVFRSLESAQFSSELGKDSCRNRIVCQIHQDIPNMWDATRVITPFLSKPHSSELNKAVQTYLSTARRGSRSQKSCKDIYRTCKLPYISLKPIISLFFRPKSTNDKNSVE